MVLIKRPTIKQEIKAVEHEFFRTISTLIVSSFGLVAALAWNTAITKILEQYLALKPGSTVISWLIYAFLVTLLAVFTTIYLGRLGQRLARQSQTLDKTQNKED